MRENSIHIKARTLMPLGLTIFFFCFCGFLLTMWSQYRYINKGVEERLQNARTLFIELINTEAEVLAGLSRSYSVYLPLHDAYLTGNRQQLQEKAQPLFKEIHNRHQVTHFYFHSTDKNCFLRVHNPDRHSDQITRYTLAQSSQLGEPSFGLELGPLGTMTLRAVQPWRKDGKLIGFIELGKEIDHITPLLKRIMGLDLVFAIEKKFLDRELWEEGLQMLNKSGDWNDYTNHVITSSTFIELPESLGRKLADHQKDHDRKPFDVYHNGRVFRSGVIPLYDAGGIEVGDVFAFADYTPVNSSRNLIIFFATFCFILLAIFWVFLSSYFRELEKELHNSMKKLDDLMTTSQDNSQKALDHKEGSGSSEPQEQGP